MISSGNGQSGVHHTVELAEILAQRLRSLGWTCATAESCTGGGIALGITSVPGSSDYMMGGIVAYSNRVKQGHLGVLPETLAAVGAVSRECAAEMARGVRASLDADVGISSTGIAGPGGGTDRKPVGFVYVGVATPTHEEVRELQLTGDRLNIMQDSVNAALELAIRVLGEQSEYREK